MQEQGQYIELPLAQLSTTNFLVCPTLQTSAQPFVEELDNDRSSNGLTPSAKTEKFFMALLDTQT